MGGIIMNQKNPLNMNINSIKMNQTYDDERIEIIFEQEGKVNTAQRIKCFYDELIISVINKYFIKNRKDKGDCKFIFNGKKLNENLTVEESGITNFSKVKVIIKDYLKNINYSGNNMIKSHNIKNIIFSFENIRDINIQCNYEETVGDAIKKYCTKINENHKSLFNNCILIYNGIKINKKDLYSKIGIFFKSNYIPRIIINSTQNLVGN